MLIKCWPSLPYPVSSVEPRTRRVRGFSFFAVELQRVRGARKGGLCAPATLFLGLLAKLGVAADEMAQRPEQLARTVAVAPRQGGADVVDDHVADLLRPVLLAEQVFPERSGGDLGPRSVERFLIDARAEIEAKGLSAEAHTRSVES